MQNHPNLLRLLQNIGSILGALTVVFAAFKFILQPAYKIASAQERARIAEATSDSYKQRVDDLIRSNDILVRQIHAQSKIVDEQVKRTDMALLYIAERFAWERRGRIGAPPILPEVFEAALYDIASRLKTEEVPEPGSPFPSAPEEGA